MKAKQRQSRLLVSRVGWSAGDGSRLTSSREFQATLQPCLLALILAREREQGVVRVAKAKGLSYSTVRVSKLGDDRRASPTPLISPKNTPRPGGGKVAEASRSVVANTVFRAAYQVREADVVVVVLVGVDFFAYFCSFFVNYRTKPKKYRLLKYVRCYIIRSPVNIYICIFDVMRHVNTVSCVSVLMLYSTSDCEF